MAEIESLIITLVMALISMLLWWRSVADSFLNGHSRRAMIFIALPFLGIGWSLIWLTADLVFALGVMLTVIREKTQGH